MRSLSIKYTIKDPENEGKFLGNLKYLRELKINAGYMNLGFLKSLLNLEVLSLGYYYTS